MCSSGLFAATAWLIGRLDAEQHWPLLVVFFDHVSDCGQVLGLDGGVHLGQLLVGPPPLRGDL
jgi:hypothetical protein